MPNRSIIVVMPLHDRTRRIVGAGLLAVVLGLSATGCIQELVARDVGGDDETKPAQASRKMTFDLAAEQRGKVTIDVPAKPLATVPTSTAKMNLELYAAKRTGEVVDVVFALHNTGDAGMKTDGVTVSMDEDPFSTRHDVSNVAIVDPKGLKEYRTYLQDPDSDDAFCLCSYSWQDGDTQDFAPDERRYYVSEVAAPPAEVTQVTILTGNASVRDVRLEG